MSFVVAQFIVSLELVNGTRSVPTTFKSTYYSIELFMHISHLSLLFPYKHLPRSGELPGSECIEIHA